MKCKRCGKDFDNTNIEESAKRDRGDGVMYGSSSYSSRPICPHCGCDNSVKVYMTGRGKYDGLNRSNHGKK